MMNAMRTVLTRDDMARACPAIFADHAAPKTSSKYRLIPTTEVLDLMESEGWQPVTAHYQKVRLEGRNGYQKHLIRFQHPDLVLGEEALDCILLNSHDGGSSYRFMLGIWRMICSNGMMVGETWQEVRVRHMGSTPDMILDASKQITQQAPKLAQKIKDWKQIEMTRDEAGIFASAAGELLTTEQNPKPFIDYTGRDHAPDQLLRTRRYQDQSGLKKPNLWLAYNTVQENLIKGGFRKFNATAEGGLKKGMSKSREVKSIDKNLALNRALFTLTEKMEEILRSKAA